MAKKAKTLGKRGGWGKSAPGRQAASKVKAPKPLKAKAKANGSAKAKAKPAKKTGPRSQVLPGMEQVRNVLLDNMYEKLGEALDAKNEAIREEVSLRAGIQTQMQALGITVYVHASTEGARIPGVGEKLRIRRIKNDGDAQVSAQETRRDEVVTHADDDNEPTADEQDAADEFTVADV